MEWISEVGKRTFSFWQRSLRTRTDKPFDFIIAGAGIAGASIAFWLRKMVPHASILVLEAGRIAQGASGRNAGFLLQGSAEDFVTASETFGIETATQLWKFSRENQRLIRENLQPAVFDHIRSGSFVAAGDDREAARLRESENRLQELGFDVTYMNDADSNRTLGSQGFYGALYCPEDGTVHPAKLVRHILDLSGADIHEGEPVIDINTSTDGIVQIETDMAQYSAKRLILALNAYLPALLPYTSRYVHPVRAQMMSFRSRTDLGSLFDAPIYSHRGYFYTRKFGSDQILVGGARHLFVDTEVGFQDATTKGLQSELHEYLHRHFPQIDVNEVTDRWSGVMGFSPDHIPVLGTVEGIPAAFFITGFTGHGMGYGFHMGKILARWVTLERFPEEAFLFRSDRLESVS